jgi:hypothetical protein
MSESVQGHDDTACHRFCDLKKDFKCLHRVKYAQYIERERSGIKTNPRIFFRFADIKKNSTGYPSAMFVGVECARYSQGIADVCKICSESLREQCLG